MADNAPLGQMNWLDRQFADTHMFFVILAAVCCAPIGIVLGLIGLVVCQHPDARQKSMWLVVVPLILFGIGFLLNVMQCGALSVR